MKRIIPILTLFLCQGCMTCLKGDLAEGNLDQDPLPVAIGQIEIEGLQHAGEQSAVEQLRSELRIASDAVCSDRPVDLFLRYQISRNYWQTEFMPKFTMWTLGLVPLYANGNADIDVAFLRDGKPVYRTRIDSRSHSFYGWLPPFMAVLLPGSDWVEWSEQSRVDDFVEKEALQRTLPRLSRLLRQDRILNQICPPAFHASR